MQHCLCPLIKCNPHCVFIYKCNFKIFFFSDSTVMYLEFIMNLACLRHLVYLRNFLYMLWKNRKGRNLHSELRSLKLTMPPMHNFISDQLVSCKNCLNQQRRVVRRQHSSPGAHLWKLKHCAKADTNRCRNIVLTWTPTDANANDWMTTY